MCEQQLSSVLTSLRNNHVYREVNFYAHRFANMRITSGDGLIIYDVCPDQTVFPCWCC